MCLCIRQKKTVHCEAHCQIFFSLSIYNLKTVIDSNKILTDLSKGGA